MKKLFAYILAVAMIFLSGCTQTPPAETEPSSPAQTAASSEPVDVEETEPSEVVLFEPEVVELTDVVPIHDTEAACFSQVSDDQQNSGFYEAAYFHFPNDGHNKYMRHADNVT